MKRRALMIASQMDGGNEGGLTFLVYLVEGSNGELGVAVYNYFIENYSFGMHTLDNKTQVYIENELQDTVLVTNNVTFNFYYSLMSDGIIAGQ